jgi:hypothetical protein
MKNVVKTGLFALLLAFASCQNSSPAPQAAKQDKDSTNTKPAEPTVLPNVKCYEGVVVAKDLCSNTVVVQVKTDSIGISSKVFCLGNLRNVLTLDMPSPKVVEGCKVGEQIYFTISKFVNHIYEHNTEVGSNEFRSILPCPNMGVKLCPNTVELVSGVPLKGGFVSSYSFKNCESKK